jgi:chondroitin AC lyase
MNIKFTFLLSLILVIFLLPQKANAQTDYEKIIANVNSEIKKGYGKTTTAINAGITTLIGKMNPDGSFNDLNYVAGVNGDVPFNDHLTRLRTMAVAYTYPGATYFEDASLYNKIVSGLQYWNANIHDAYNWYNDQISYPKLIGEFLIEMRGGKLALPSTDETNAINFLTSRDNPSGQTGANRVDESVHWIYSGALTNDAARVKTGVTQAQSTLVLVNSGLEGINTDFAFLQHESQIMMQGYGRDFLNGIYNVAIYIVGSSFAFTTAQLENAYLFLHNSYVGAARGPYKDFNLDGRGISRINSNKGITANIIANAMTVDPAHAASLQADSLRVTQVQPPSYKVTQPYHVHFWTGDYTMHNRPGYSIGVRTVSTRTVRTETMNGENLLGAWLSDGATSIRIDGDEYSNIFPIWDWNKVPGITMREFATPQQNPNRYVASSYGNTTFVGGVSDSTYGASTYKLNNGGVTGTKSWFFFDNEIVCLGAGINSSQSENIATTLNQTFLKGAVTVKAGGATSTMSAATQQNANNIEWVLHNKVGYFFPSGGNVFISNVTQSGNWSTIGTSTGAVTADVFKLWINQGVKPVNSTYAYIVAPGITTETAMNSYNSSAIKILSNTTAIQAVMQSDLNIVEVIFSSAGTLTLNGTEVSSITVDKPCAVIIKGINTIKPSVSIADPAQNSTIINLSLTFKSVSQENFVGVMPTGNYKGSSKAISAGTSAPLFTPGVLAVVRIGGVNGTNGASGTTNPGTSGVPVHIDKFAVTGPGTFEYQSTIDLPVNSTNNIFASSSLNEGYIIQSANKQWLSVMGYADVSASGTIYGAGNTNLARTLGLIKYDGTVDLSTALSNYPYSGTAATAQSSITNNGTDLWSVTNQGVSPMGVLYTTPGSKDAKSGNSKVITSSTSVVTSSRSLSIFGGDLYFTGGSGSRIGTVSATGGLPTMSGTSVMTGLKVAAGSTAFTTYAPSQMVMFDVEPSILGFDVLYFTNTSTAAGMAGIYKYCKNADGEWVAYGSFGSTSADGVYFGITGEVINGLPVLYITRGVSTTTTVATNQLLQVMEGGGYNENLAFTITATIDATASGNKGTLRGVAFYPTPTYYYKGSGNLNEVANWGSNIDGSGTNPSNFTADQQTFFITNGSAATLSADLTVSGTNSKIILGDGTNPTSLTIPANFSIHSEMDVYNNAVLNIQNMVSPDLHFVAQNSNINLAGSTSQTIDTMAYGNFSNNNTSSATLNGTMTVAGNLVQNGLLKGNATFIVSNGFTNAGTLAPGNSPGLMTVTGNFTNDAAGKLEIELSGAATAGSDYDLLVISGNAIIAGTLDIIPLDGFVLLANQEFTIIQAGSISGSFTTVNWPAGVTGTVIYNTNTVVIHITSVVPLHLISFTGSVLQDGKNQLQWKTSNEDNVDYYSIERSDNGNGFSNLLRQKAVGKGDNNYQIFDETPLSGFNYYRLKMFDKDGRYTYSNIIRLKNNSTVSFSIFPNPAKSNLTVTHPAGDQNSYIRLSQTDGKILLTQRISVGTLQSTLNISALTPGIYFITVYSDKAKDIFKIIKE